MSSPLVAVAAFGIITNNANEILFLKRQNTGFADGYYQLPSGHLETIPHESIEETCIREILEEVGIVVKKEDISLRFIHHSYGEGTKNYMGFFFDIHKYSGNIINAEPDKCELLEWIHPRDFPNKKIIKYTKENLLNNNQVLRCAKYDVQEDFLG